MSGTYWPRVDIEQEGSGTVILNRCAATPDGFRITARTLKGEDGITIGVVDEDGGTLVIRSNVNVSPDNVRAGPGMTISGSNVVAGGTLTVALANILPTVTTFYSAVVNERGQVTGGATIAPATSSLSPANIIGSTGILVTGTIGPTGGTVTLALSPTLPAAATYTTVLVNAEGRVTGGLIVRGDGSIGTIAPGLPSAGSPIVPVRTVVDTATTFPAIPLVSNPGAATIAVRQIQAGDGINVSLGDGTVLVTGMPRDRHIPVDLTFTPNGSLVGCAPTFVQPNISVIVQDDGDLQIIHPDAEVLDVAAWLGGPDNTLTKVLNPSYSVTLSITSASTIVSNLNIGTLGGRGQVSGRMVFVVRSR